MTCAPLNFFLIFFREGGGGEAGYNLITEEEGGRLVRKFLFCQRLHYREGGSLLLGDVFSAHKKLLKIVLNKHIIEYFKDQILVTKSCRK